MFQATMCSSSGGQWYEYNRPPEDEHIVARNM